VRAVGIGTPAPRSAARCAIAWSVPMEDRFPCRAAHRGTGRRWSVAGWVLSTVRGCGMDCRVRGAMGRPLTRVAADKAARKIGDRLGLVNAALQQNPFSLGTSHMLWRTAKWNGMLRSCAASMLRSMACIAFAACARAQPHAAALAPACSSARYDRTFLRHVRTPVRDANVEHAAFGGVMIHVAPLDAHARRERAFGYVRLTSLQAARNFAPDTGGWVRAVPADTGLTTVRAAMLGYQSLTDTVRIRAGYVDTLDIRLRRTELCLDRVTI
jgi:hypothetical protein